MRCDYWLRPPYYLLIAKNNTLRKSAPLLPPGALFCPRSAFLVRILAQFRLSHHHQAFFLRRVAVGFLVQELTLDFFAARQKICSKLARL